MLGCARRSSALLLAVAVSSTALALAPAASAAELAEGGAAPRSLELRGFVSQGFLKTTANDYLVDSSRGSSAFSEAGINFTTQLTDKLQVGVQLFAFDLGTTGAFAVRADWFYLDYRARDWVGVRAGRLKIPYGLYNHVSDIESSRRSAPARTLRCWPRPHQPPPRSTSWNRCGHHNRKPG